MKIFIFRFKKFTMNNFLKFVKKYQNEDSITGDFCSDVLRDRDFPINGIVKQMKDHVEFKASQHGISDQFTEFVEAYNTFVQIQKD